MRIFFLAVLGDLCENVGAEEKVIGFEQRWRRRYFILYPVPDDGVDHCEYIICCVPGVGCQAFYPVFREKFT